MSIRYTSEQLQRKFAGPAGAPGYARVADAFRTEGRLEEAIGICREGLRTRPLVAGYVVLGKSLVDAGNLEEAREQFEAALRLDPRCLSAMHSLAAILGKLQWGDAAAGYYRSILELEPWDAEIRSLLEGVAQTDGMPAAPSAAALAPAAPARPAPEEDTYIKPEGLDGDVLEVNLNDVADDFLPSGGEDPALSLEDALEPEATTVSGRDFSPAMDPAPDTAPDAALDPSSDRGSADGLQPTSSGPETLGENAPAPISGSDVEERLDSLFGAEDGGAPSATATWTAASAFSDGLPDGSATATGELRAAEPVSGMDYPEATAHFDLAEAPDMGSPDPMPAETEAGPAGADQQVQGEDIERRLDELFQLSGDDDAPAPLSASALPVAPGPQVGETVILGEAVSFGDSPIPFGELKDSAIAAEPDTEDASATPSAGEAWVTGQDVADKLDTLFGAEREERAGEAAAAPVAETAPAAGDEEVLTSAAPFFAEGAPREPGADEALLSTETMLPSGWSGDGPQVTGEDVEAQLDKLFNLEAAPERNLDETVTFERPPERKGDGPGLGEGEKGRLKESVADWLTRQDDGPSAGDTLILPNEGMQPEAGLDGAPEAKAGEEIFGTLAPEEVPALSETASIEMVDGGDVAQRLDKLFSDAPGGSGGEIPLFDPEEPALPEIAAPEIPLPGFTESEAEMTLEMPIQELTDEDLTVSDPGFPPLSPAGIESEDMEQPSALASAPGGLPDAGGKAAPELAPMLDEEEGYPDEEEMPTQAGAANVATVTLAEIYFQQGLKEQALQIYRQLLEREPENESVRKRIAEIEASKPDSDRGPDSDPRRPRPGLKVPKRKK